MYPATAIRVAQFRNQDLLAEAAPERQAIEAEQAQTLGSGSAHAWSRNGFVAAIVAFLGAANIFGWGR